MSEVCLRVELSHVYVDPVHAPSILAYIPEVHASASCHRALSGGMRVELPELGDPAGIAWCDVCTTLRASEATMRRGPDGRWAPAG